MVAGLLGGINVDEGPTEEQLLVLSALVTHLWHRPDLDLAAMTPLNPGETATQLTDLVVRRRFHEIHMTLEACRHPQSKRQVDIVETYARELHTSGEDLALFRTFIDEGSQRADQDFQRFMGAMLAERVEPSLAAIPIDVAHAEPELANRILAFSELPHHTLGREFLDYYERHALSIPGVQPSSMNHFFVGHDMTHIIAGLETTAAGEVALSGFQMGMNDNDINVSALLASLVAHEAGFGSPGTFTAEERTLQQSGAAVLLAKEIARGSQCSGDFSLVDHFALAHLPLSEVREHFGVLPPEDLDDGHHWW